MTQGSGKRQTQPGHYNPFSHAPLGLIPRRSVSERDLFSSLISVRDLAQRSPNRLLALLLDVHPAVSYATWNALRLSCAQGDSRIVAMKTSSAGQGDEAMDEEGTALLDALWQSLPAEIGGFTGLQSTLTLEALFTGMCSVEAVPGRSGEGVRRVWPVDSLTIQFGRDSADSDLTAYQKQTGKGFGWQRLDSETFFWKLIDNLPDSAEGRAPYFPALSEALADFAMMQDVRDAVHQAAWPRLQIGFNFAETFKIAREVMGIVDPNEAASWVSAQFDEVVKYVKDLKADDAIVHDTNGKGEIIGGGGFVGLTDVLSFLRHRIVQSLKSLPTLMGINDGSAQTYTSVEWAIYASGLETLRSMVLEVLVKVADLHLRLLGKALSAQAKTKPIRTNDENVDAQTEAIRIANAKEKRNQNWITQEEASIEITGSGPVGPAPEPVGATGDGSSGQDNLDTENRDEDVP